MLRVYATKPLLRTDLKGNTVDMSKPGFKKNPKKVFEVPDTPFWRKRMAIGELAAAPSPPKKKSAPKKTSGGSNDKKK